MSEIYKKVSDCLLEEMDGEVLLYNPNNVTTLHLNASSAIVWELCDGKNNVSDIVVAIKEAFPEQIEQIEGDVRQAISELFASKVLEKKVA